MSDASVMIPKDEYDILKRKAYLFDHYVETEELSKEEKSAIIAQIQEIEEAMALD